MNNSDNVSPWPDASLVLARRPTPHVEWVEIEGEAVAWNAEEGALHRLDPIATLVFQLCDGSETLERTVADLAEAFGQPVESLEEDVLGCAGRLLDGGLVEVRS